MTRQVEYDQMTTITCDLCYTRAPDETTAEQLREKGWLIGSRVIICVECWTSAASELEVNCLTEKE